MCAQRYVRRPHLHRPRQLVSRRRGREPRSGPWRWRPLLARSRWRQAPYRCGRVSTHALLVHALSVIRRPVGVSGPSASPWECCGPLREHPAWTTSRRTKPSDVSATAALIAHRKFARHTEVRVVVRVFGILFPLRCERRRLAVVTEAVTWHVGLFEVRSRLWWSSRPWYPVGTASLIKRCGIYSCR